MSYSNSPLLPKARRQAVNLVLKEGFGVSTAARRDSASESTEQRVLLDEADISCAGREHRGHFRIVLYVAINVGRAGRHQGLPKEMLVRDARSEPPSSHEREEGHYYLAM